MKSILNSILLGILGLAIAVMTTGSLSSAIATQPPWQLAQRAPRIVYVRREVSGPPAGGRYRGGGSRGIGSQAVCPTTPVPLTALVPFEEIYDKTREKLPPLVNVWGFTTAERPTFWVYNPYNNSAIPAKFSIDDESAGQTLYETSVTLPKQPGVMALRLSNSAPVLQPGKRYRWFLSLTCKAPTATAAGTDNINVEAVVIRELPKPELTSQLTATPSLQNAIAYAKAGFWYDALTILAELRQKQPQDETLKTAWKELLSGVALDNLTPTSERSRQNFSLETISSQPVVN
ncbi:MAG: DUF928 domain-containing protein [Leptolyngbyaceae cyanobacterium bins.349]|nr:DUF928 domain-containing protein [Leptolyngbyaceae cyanobacterium bins.349]